MSLIRNAMQQAANSKQVRPGYGNAQTALIWTGILH